MVLSTSLLTALLLLCGPPADGRITFDEWLQAMSGRSNLIEQREERMQEKRRSMAQGERGGKSPSQNRTTLSALHAATAGAVAAGGMGQLKEEEEQKEQSVSSATERSTQPPAIVVAS